MSKEKDLDDLFKRKLADPVDEPAFNEAHWSSFEQMLDAGKKRKGIIYWPLYGSAAALLLLFLGYWMLNKGSQAGSNGGSKPLVAAHPPKHPGTQGASAGQQPVQSPASPASALTATRQPGKASILHTGGSVPSVAVTRPIAGKNDVSLIADNAGTQGNSNVPANKAGAKQNSGLLESKAPQPVFGAQHIELPQLAFVDLRPKNTVTVTSAGKPPVKPVKTQAAYRPQLALSVIAAPDINGVGSFAQSKVGTNEGLLFSAGLTRRFSISTGVIYSSKPYFENFSDYHTPYKFQVDPVNVTADCRMLDIPVNLNYMVYKKSINSFYVGTGLSSYIMLHESYKFNYAAGTQPNYYQTSPLQYTVPGTDGYYFGVLNLNVTYQRQLTGKVSLSVQPYMKLPLTNLGYSQVKLQTTGVALGLTWNLNASAKP